jgi:hypothetical protein
MVLDLVALSIQSLAACCGQPALWSRGAIDSGRIPLMQTIANHLDYPADHPPFDHARNATRPRHACEGLPWGQTGHGARSSSISLNLFQHLASPAADDFGQEKLHDDDYHDRL